MNCKKCNSEMIKTTAKLEKTGKEIPCLRCMKCGDFIFNEKILKDAIREMKNEQQT